MRTFKSFREWLGCVKSAATHLSLGVWHALQAVVVGFISLLCALWRVSVRSVGKYPHIALGAFLVALALTWLFTFVAMRARAVGAEARLGMVSYEYRQFKESHGYE